MVTKAQAKFKKGDIIRHKERGVVCKCLSIDVYGDIIYILGEELSQKKGPHKFLRYEEDQWEKGEEGETTMQ